ncbi:motility associated factor glycosyltransferase family protein [Ureibacillus thermosphaericus]|uniref:6-hydroxymethylpterin diphosphokinase MptE-like domain-containing protein n=1 Tax=Ureibacillus thermosphaericus TaxID=51173 RepID=A0A840PMT3_URETH|nr:6-hydroxymethylpterin diphosphokinase MptE-like protein [Ureibacillus thermosphaericus]MBB5149725.1 hypothetical protein [Ureibacillus thermosphaericus]NKZ32641.1 motility associated factor glycosyltransferase family protein [Ureibacillus thermosphaericus]
MYTLIREVNSRNIEVIKIKDHHSNRMIALNSQVSPQKEIEKFIEQLRSNKCYFIIGSGNGTLLQYLIDLKLKSKIYILEPFKEIDFDNELKGELKKNNIYFFHEENLNYLQITGAIRSSTGMEFEILFHPNYDKLSKNILNPIIQKIKMGTTTASINKNTEKFFRFDWLIEPILNLSLSKNGKSLLEIKENFLGKPFILVASGPSLVDNLDFIKKNQDKAYILASGSAVNGLLNNGIIPDFVTIIDASLVNFTAHFENTKYSGPIITTGTANHLILKHHKGELYFTNFELDTITAEVRPDFLKVSTVSSVAIYSLLLTHYLGASEVFLVGQDLALKDGKYYANGVHEHQASKNLGDIVEVEGNIGGKVSTNLNLASMLENFNNAVSVIQEVNNQIKIYNLSKSGAKIKDVPFKDKNDIMLAETIDKSWIPTNVSKKEIDYTLSLEYYKKIIDSKKEVDDISRKIKKINSKAVTFKDLEKLLKLIKKLRQNAMIETHILNMIYSSTKSINNMFEFGFEGNFQTNEERVEMLKKLLDFVEIVQNYLEELIQHNNWPEIFKRR